jgi:hypothetical protein
MVKESAFEAGLEPLLVQDICEAYAILKLVH